MPQRIGGMSVLGLAAAIAAPIGAPALPVAFQFSRVALKAQVAEEAGQRILYMQASSEVRDLQGEKVLLSALAKSIPYFLQYGRIDLDHASVLGEIRGQKVNPYAYEIGKPLDARVDGDSVWVKAAIFTARGSGNRWTEAADLFWDSLQTSPPTVWYPSIAGDVFAEAPTFEDGRNTQEIRGIRWHSIGLSRTPVNHTVGPVTTMPVRAFAKAFASRADLEEALGSFVPGRGLTLETLPTPKAGDPDVIAILQTLNDAQPDLGVDGFLDLAGQRGIPPEHAMAVLLTMLRP